MDLEPISFEVDKTIVHQGKEHKISRYSRNLDNPVDNILICYMYNDRLIMTKYSWGLTRTFRYDDIQVPLHEILKNDTTEFTKYHFK